MIMGKKMDGTAFLLLSVLGIAFILTFHPEGRAGAQTPTTPCGSYNYASFSTCLGGCGGHCADEAARRQMLLISTNCPVTNPSLCQCSCAAGVVGTPCGYPSYYNGNCNATTSDGNCYKDCQAEANRLNLPYGSSFCNGDVCQCFCKSS